MLFDDLIDKNILITGALGLLGKSFCDFLSELGANILATDVPFYIDPSVRDRYSTNFLNNYRQLDVTSEDSIKSAFLFARKKMGHIDVVINNAAVNPKREDRGIRNSHRLENYIKKNWDNELSVGLTGPFLVSKTYLNMCIDENKQGNIINIASDLSLIAPNQTLYYEKNKKTEQSVKPISYSAIKHGLIGLTKYIATYKPELLRANSISPGGIFNNQDQVFLERIKKQIPLNRMAELDDLHGVIALLCSDKSAYINGHNLVVDGGRTIW